jgi:IS5 family transposase
MVKAVGQVSLVEALLPAAYGSNQRLERIGTQVDWAPIEALLQPMRQAPTGRPAYPAGPAEGAAASTVVPPVGS